MFTYAHVYVHVPVYTPDEDIGVGVHVCIADDGKGGEGISSVLL